MRLVTGPGYLILHPTSGKGLFWLSSFFVSDVSCVRNLGVVFDKTLNMEKQVSATSKSCFYQIRNIGRIRTYITDDAFKTLVNSLVTSRLDYGNVMLYGLPANITNKLQRVQNTATRLISRTKKHQHITPILVSRFSPLASCALLLSI
jgi:hypothetical protein